MSEHLPQGWTTASLSDIADINPRHPRDLDGDLLVSFAPMPALSESRPEFNGLRERPLGEVRIAPLGEQQRIVTKLEKLLGKADTCQQRLAKIPALLKRFRQSVLAAACSGRLTTDWREQAVADAKRFAKSKAFEAAANAD